MHVKQLKDPISHLLKKLYSKKGDLFAEIASNWKIIAGDSIALHVTPRSIKYYKTQEGKKVCLILSPTSTANVLELKFYELQIIERINIYMGYVAVTSIKFSA